MNKLIQTETGNGVQIPPANPGSRCPLFSSKRCRQAPWCHDKVQEGQARRRVWQESQAAQPPQDNALSPRARAYAAKLARTSASCERGLAASPLRNPESPLRSHPASAAMPEAPCLTSRLLGPRYLRWLETLQALSRFRCWLLRNWLTPFLPLHESKNSTSKSHD